MPFGIGLVWSFQAVFVYLVDAFRPVAASAMAANSALRSSFAAGFPMFTRPSPRLDVAAVADDFKPLADQMFSRLGTQVRLGSHLREAFADVDLSSGHCHSALSSYSQ